MQNIVKTNKSEVQKIPGMIVRVRYEELLQWKQCCLFPGLLNDPVSNAQFT
jgi:hypothetical protein